jgi:hypothetical protein
VTENTNAVSDAVEIKQLSQTIIDLRQESYLQHIPNLHTTLSYLISKETPSKAHLQKAMLLAIYVSRHNKESLLDMASLTDFPWTEEHGRIFSRTRLAGELQKHFSATP